MRISSVVALTAAVVVSANGLKASKSARASAVEAKKMAEAAREAATTAHSATSATGDEEVLPKPGPSRRGLVIACLAGGVPPILAFAFFAACPWLIPIPDLPPDTVDASLRLYLHEQAVTRAVTDLMLLIIFIFAALASISAAIAHFAPGHPAFGHYAATTALSTSVSVVSVSALSFV